MAELVPLAVLRTEYEGGPGSDSDPQYSSNGFIKQIDFLIANGYEGIRRSRGDGDCFYRCVSCTTVLLITTY